MVEEDEKVKPERVYRMRGEPDERMLLKFHPDGAYRTSLPVDFNKSGKFYYASFLPEY